MVVFSHRGKGFGKRENSLEAFATSLKQGYSVEADLRIKDNHIVLSHDLTEETEEKEEFNVLLNLIKENPLAIFALHLKENSQVLFKKTSDFIRPFKNYFLFLTDFKQDDFIINMFKIIGKEHLALYVNSKELDLNLVDKVGYFWLDETKEDIYEDLHYFIKFNKKIICCSPELFITDYREKLKIFKTVCRSNSRIFGICTDFPEVFK